MIKLYNMDCMDGMKNTPDKFYELAICDPPYGIGSSKFVPSRYFNPSKKWPNPNILQKYPHKEWDNVTPIQEYFDELFRVSKNQIIWGANHYITKINRDSTCWLVWDKLNEGWSGMDCELAWASFKTTIRKFNYLWQGFLKQDPITRIHPTQKPVKLYEWLLRNYAKEGDKILDTHGGSCSLAIACYNMGFDCTIYEIDKDYYEAAMKRLEEHKRQGRLFDAVKVI